MPHDTFSDKFILISELEMVPKDFQGMNGGLNFLQANFRTARPSDKQLDNFYYYLSDNMKGPFFVHLTGDEIRMTALLAKDLEVIKNYNFDTPWKTVDDSSTKNAARLNLRATYEYSHRDVCMQILTDYIHAVDRKVDEKEISVLIGKIWPYRNNISRGTQTNKPQVA